jgi:hypothetical protein
VEEVLGHYFDCVAIHYPHYEDHPVAAVLKVVIEPWALVGGLAAGIFLLFRLFFQQQTVGPFHEHFYDSLVNVVFFYLTITFIVVGVALAYRRRKQAEAEVRQQIQRTMIGGVGAHLIAHSLGTYLTCRMLRTVQGLKLRRVIYVGSVVKRKFSWDLLTGHRIEALRNEVGGQDSVVLLAGMAKWLFFLTDLGWAGWKGFLGSATDVHSSTEADWPCGRCSIQPLPAPVHNSLCPYDAHNTLFMSGFHAARFWLPFLWEYDPGYFQAFLERCQSLTQLGRADFLEAFNRLRYASWGGRLCFEEMVVREIRAKLKLSAEENPDPSKVSAVLFLTWSLIVKAQNGMEKIVRPREEAKLVKLSVSAELREALRNYDPRVAVWCAIGAVFSVDSKALGPPSPATAQ